MKAASCTRSSSTKADTVEKGDILLRLNDVEARSNLHVIDTRLDVARIVEARLLAERKMADTLELPNLNVGQSSDPVQSTIADQKEPVRGSPVHPQVPDGYPGKPDHADQGQIEGLEIQNPR